MTADRNRARFFAILVEGIPGAGNSTLVDALLRRHVEAAAPRKIRTLVHLAQTHTYGPLAAGEDDGTLTVAESSAHLARIVETLEWLRDGVRDPRHPPCFVAIDTLHLTHCMRPGVLTWDDAVEFDRRLAALDVKLVALRIGPDLIWDRLIRGREETQFIREYCRKFGSTASDIHAYFVNEQERSIELYERSAMRKTVYSGDRNSCDVEDAAYATWLDSRPAIQK